MKVMTSELENGYIFKNFFTFSCIKSRISITFMSDKITSFNAAAQNEEMFQESFLYGDEIGMVWDASVPVEDRTITIAFDAQKLQSTFASIKKKDQSRIVLAQIRTKSEFDPQGTDFILFVSKGAGGDGREGIERCGGTRVFDEEKLIINKPPQYSSILVVPNRMFKQMIDTFTKCKKKRICITFYDNKDHEEGSGITITDKGVGSNIKGKGPYEKFGNIPDIDPSSIFSEGTGEESENTPINEYSFDSSRLVNLLRLSALHNEGNVRIFYEPKYPLRLAARFGSFGECELYIYDKKKYQMVVN